LTAFYLACAGLVLLSGLFYLLPRAHRRDSAADSGDTSADWYRLRQRELEQEGAPDELRDDAQLRLLEDDAQAPEPAARDTSGSFPVWILLPAVAVSAAVLYYLLGAAADVQITRQLRAIGEATTPAEMDALIDAIEARSAQRPDNLHYLALLGRYHMGQGDYAAAQAVYDALVQAVPGDAQALAYAAQAEYLAAGRVLNDSARLRAEQALAANPHQSTALGLLGMASYEEGRYRAAIEYWERLLATEAPDSESARLIADVLARARQAVGDAPAQAAVQPRAEQQRDDTAPAGVTVRVALPPGAAVDPADTVFVLARPAGTESRMPIAVQRLSGAQLPATLRLDDSNSMAGQRLSTFDAVLLVAQVSPSGRPGEANATWVGEAGPVAPSAAREALDIELRPRQP